MCCFLRRHVVLKLNKAKTSEDTVVNPCFNSTAAILYKAGQEEEEQRQAKRREETRKGSVSSRFVSAIDSAGLRLPVLSQPEWAGRCGGRVSRSRAEHREDKAKALPGRPQSPELKHERADVRLGRENEGKTKLRDKSRLESNSRRCGLRWLEAASAEL